MTHTPSMTTEQVRALYVEHGGRLRQTLARLAPELDADDLLQELFVIALRKRGALGRADSRLAWLFGVAVRLASTRRRTARLRRLFGLEAAKHPVAVDVASRTVEQRDAQRRVERALESLSVAKREVLVLFELQGLSGEDISAALNIPVKTVWTRLFHARRELTDAVERQLVAEARTTGLDREDLEP